MRVSRTHFYRIDKFRFPTLFIVSLFFACSSNTKYITKNSSITVDSTATANNKAVQLIKPYKEKLDAEMNEVLVISSEEFPKEKGKAQTKLGNLVADLSLEVAQKMYADSIDFCLLNFGGLRTSLPKGEITRGKIFELMPFENELVVVTIPKLEYYSIETYLFNVGGQPISGHKFTLKEGTIENTDVSQMFEDAFSSKEIKILTSDYLANGGDNMTFFANPIKYEKVGIKLRDAIIQYCKEQHQQDKQLKGVIDNRIVFQK